MNGFRAFVHSRMRALRRATTPWVKYGKRKLDRRAPDDPLRKVKLRARGRKFLRDADSSEKTNLVMVSLMAIMAMCIGYRIAHIWDFDAGGTLLAPFVLVAICLAIWGRIPLGARILALAGGAIILLWPLIGGGS